MQLKEENKKLIRDLYAKYEQDKLNSKYNETCRELKRMTQLHKNASLRAEELLKKRKFQFSILSVSSFLILLACVIIFDWNIMGKVTWICSFLIAGLTYAYLFIHGKSFNPADYFEALKKQCIDTANNEFMVNLNEISELEELKNQLDEQITSPHLHESYHLG